jgi:hypothetical protein
MMLLAPLRKYSWSASPLLLQVPHQEPAEAPTFAPDPVHAEPGQAALTQAAKCFTPAGHLSRNRPGEDQLPPKDRQRVQLRLPHPLLVAIGGSPSSAAG